MTAHYVPNGSHLFAVISRYDDVLADVLKRPGYKAGDTLKLILPFLKAYGVTDKKMQFFSSKTLVLISNIKESLEYIRKNVNAFIVSTSYEHYVKELCHVLNFPFQNTYCTKVNLDYYKLKNDEKIRLRDLAYEIAKMPIIELSHEAKSIENILEGNIQTIQRLDEIFWEEIAKMDIGKIFREVNPIGGHEKAEAVKRIAENSNISLADVIYVGDSITDVEAFRKVRQEGGLTISFNGNEYAVREAEIAVIAEKALVTAVLTDVFSKFGKKGVIELVDSWNPKTIKALNLDEGLKKKFLDLHGSSLPRVETVKKENIERLSKESTVFRKNVRGEAIGRLG